jgi:UDPglucose--hexose-1-phosphate uridylyltransferase
VVPNKYPALDGELGRHEVVLHTPRHATSVAELSADELEDVARAWQARADAAREEGFGYVHAFVNEGRPAGGSLPHTHSQLVWLLDEPAAVARERSGPPFGDLLEEERRAGSRIVVERDGLASFCPYASRGPYEVFIAPARAEADAFASPLLGPGLVLLGELVRRLRELEGAVPLNAWLHTAPLDRPSGHWHLELLPRLTVAAGLELGAGIYVNPLPPEQAALALRPA